MKPVWMRALFLLALIGAIVFPVDPAAARRASCDEIAFAQGRGDSAADIKQALRTTDARMTACTRLAEMRAQHDTRRAAARARRLERRGH